MTAEAQSHKSLFIKVWIVLLVLTLVEVVLAYIQFGFVLMLTLLMGLSLVKAAMIMAYFMHLKFDRPVLSWTVAVPLVVCILIMVGYFFPDGYRILDFGFGGWR
jgi:cytochrome c oxidase subunit 4